jgi:hypothetical protein
MPPEEAAAVVERNPCPACEVPSGSVCRTRGGKVATKCHTPRFILVPALREDLHVIVPADRRTDSTVIRIGYARCSTEEQELASQLDALRAAGCFKVLSEKISTRVKHRHEYARALQLARDFKETAPEQVVIFVVHDLKRPARTAVELMTFADDLRTTGIQLELLTGPLAGIYDPHGVFAVLAVGIQLDRDHIRQKTLEGQRSAIAAGRHGGRPRSWTTT